jgi:hypothetical protein
MLVKALHAAGLRSTHLQVASFGAVALCLGLWTRAKTVDHDHRDNTRATGPVRRPLAPNALAERRRSMSACC